jgi:SnoaL-like domain
MGRAKRAMLVATSGLLLVAGGWAYAQQRAPSRVSPEDFIEIQQALWRNHQGFDFATTDNAEMWLRSFAADAELHNGGRIIKGEDGIRGFALDYYKGNPERRMRHWTSTFTVTPTAEGAMLSSFWMITTSESAKGSLRLGATGRYESSVVKAADGSWRIKKHVVFGEGSIIATAAQQ